MGNCFGSKSTSSKKNNNNNKKGKDIKNVAAVKREQEALSAAPSLQIRMVVILMQAMALLVPIL